jgi:hypothetical protein
MPPTPRPFTGCDAIVLAAATGLGLLLTQCTLWAWSYPTPWSARLWHLNEGWSAAAINDRISTAILLILPTLAGWTAAVLALRFLRPRPPLHEVWHQPGAVACVLILASISIEAIDILDASLRWAGPSGIIRIGGDSWLLCELGMRMLASSVGLAGFAVVVSWFVLRLGGPAKAEPSWIGRAGRALGACWIALALVLWLEKSHLGGHIPVHFLGRG